MYKYRISKYNPENRDEQGIYITDEWTSYSDIGKKIGGKVLSKQEYLEVESKCCNVILHILKENNINEVVIEELEVNYSIEEIKEMLEKKELELSAESEKIMILLNENKNVKVDELNEYIKLILRECFWCKFNFKNFIGEIEFGYDFYIYILGICISDEIINKYEQKGIFIERMM